MFNVNILKIGFEITLLECLKFYKNLIHEAITKCYSLNLNTSGTSFGLGKIHEIKITIPFFL